MATGQLRVCTRAVFTFSVETRRPFERPPIFYLPLCFIPEMAEYKQVAPFLRHAVFNVASLRSRHGPISPVFIMNHWAFSALESYIHYARAAQRLHSYKITLFAKVLNEGLPRAAWARNILLALGSSANHKASAAI